MAGQPYIYDGITAVKNASVKGHTVSSRNRNSAFELRAEIKNRGGKDVA